LPRIDAFRSDLHQSPNSEIFIRRFALDLLVSSVASRMASKRVAKIASEAVETRSSTPLFSWIRDKCLAVYRDKRTPPPGLPTPDGEAHYHYPHRFPNTQTARAKEMPKLPGGVHHRLSDVYYHERDARRAVDPPSPLYESDQQVQKFGDHTGKELSSEEVVKAVVKGPRENFGLNGPPTPGFGYEWTRDATHERDYQKKDKDLRNTERFDRFSVR